MQNLEIGWKENMLIMCPDYWRLGKGKYIVKKRKDEGLDGNNDIKKLPSLLKAFILTKNKTIMIIQKSTAFTLIVYTIVIPTQ